MPAVTETKPSGSRRADYAAMTRQDILAAARTLYAERGFFATKVEDIAAAARVAPATVYAACGGKHGLLHTLLQQWGEAPVIQSTYRRVDTMTGGEAILRATAAGTRKVREQWGDVMRMALATAPHDPRVAESLAQLTDAYRRGFVRTAQRLAAIHALRDGVSVTAATDILWFYFGYSSYFTLTDENHWTLAKAEKWLLTQARAALL